MMVQNINQSYDVFLIHATKDFEDFIAFVCEHFCRAESYLHTIWLISIAWKSSSAWE